MEEVREQGNLKEEKWSYYQPLSINHYFNLGSLLWTKPYFLQCARKKIDEYDGCIQYHAYSVSPGQKALSGYHLFNVSYRETLAMHPILVDAEAN